MSNFESAATEVFQILRSFNYSVELFDDQGNQVYEPEQACRFFAKPRGLMVAINDAGENSGLRLYFGQNTKPMEIMGLANALRMSAWKYNLLFAFRRFEAGKIEIKDFATNHSVREHAAPRSNISKDQQMDITEGMYGTSKSSYLKLENARMIVRHKARVNEESVGSRGRNISQIYVEDRQGQRFLFPSTNLAPARAMAQHVNQGGEFSDQVGTAIREMAEDYRGLLKCSRHIANHGSRLDEAAGQVRESCRQKMAEMRKVFGRMFRESGYHNEAQRITEEASALVETEEGKAAKAAKAARLREMLSVEGVELDEDMVGRVAGLVECNLDEGRKAYGENEPVVKVLGAKVNQNAWDAFVSTPGALDMFAGAGSLPAGYKPAAKPSQYARRDEELSDRLAAIAASVKDHSLSMLLMKVSERLPEETDEAKLKPMRAVAARALQLSKSKGKTPEPGTGLASKAPAIREFAEWLGGFNPDAPDHALDGAVQNVVDEFNIEDYMNSVHFSDIASNGLAASRSAIKTSLLAYLSDNLDAGHAASADMEAEATALVPRVADQLASRGFAMLEGEEMIDDDMLVSPDDADLKLTDRDLGGDMAADGASMIEDDFNFTDEADDADLQLTDEDILLPKNHKDDLRAEVTKTQVTDPDTGKQREPDGAYISRLRSLAGMRSGTPR